MIKNDNKGAKTLKEIRKKEQDSKDALIKAACEKLAIERYGEDKVTKWSNEHEGLWYMPVLGEDDKVELLAIMKPINRHILSFASSKIEDGGLYTFLEACMRECWVEGDAQILDDDEYFIPAAQSFNKIMEGKKIAFLKR